MCLNLNDYACQCKLELAFTTDAVATVCRILLSGISHFSDLLAKLIQMTTVYHSYQRCDYIFDFYSEIFFDWKTGKGYIYIVWFQYYWVQLNPQPPLLSMCSASWTTDHHRLWYHHQTGTKKAAPLPSALVQHAEQYLVKAIKSWQQVKHFPRSLSRPILF